MLRPPPRRLAILSQLDSYLACFVFCEYIHFDYVRIHVIYRVNQAEYVIHFLVVAPQEYVNIYSTRRVLGEWGQTPTESGKLYRKVNVET